MKKLLLTSVALLATGPAQADCCDMAKSVRAGHAFQIAAKRQFGRGASNMRIYREKDLRDEEKDLANKAATLDIKDARYLGVDKDYKDGSYLLCSYRTKPVIRFFKCIAWEGD
jgi:hypothetical protein